VNRFPAVWTGVAVAAVLAACLDAGTGPTGLSDPAETSAALSSVDSALAAPVVASFGALGTYINPSPFLAPPSSGTSPQGPVVPDTLYGAVFTWNPDSARYLRTQTTGGPVNGVRYVLYAVHPITGDIVVPLVPIGVVDLLDESTPITGILHVVVEDTLNTTYLDYTATLVSRVVFFTATVSGFVTNGLSGPANKTLTFTITAQLDLATITAQATFTLDVPALAVALEATSSKLEGTETASVAYTLSRPGETLRQQGYVTTTNDVLDTLSAEIRVNEQVYASLEGNAQGTTFYDRHGNVIPDAGAQRDVLLALGHLRKAVEDTLAFLRNLFNPIVNLFTR